MVRILNEGEGIAGYELNVSCPNTKCGGMSFGSDPRMLFDVVSAVKKIATRPLIVKLSPNVTSIPEVARAAEEAGADAISLVNTFVAMAIDAETRKPRISNVTAGLSGPAIKPIALRMVWEAAKTVKIPVIGLGGISTAEDVIEFLLAGASAIEVGTVNFWDPCACETLVDSLEKWCLEHRVEKISDLTGVSWKCLQRLDAGHQIRIDRQNRGGVRDVQQASHLRVGAGDTELPTVQSHLAEDAHQNAQPGAVHKVDMGQVQHQLAHAIIDQRLNHRFGLAQPGAQSEPAGAGNAGDVRLEMENFRSQNHGKQVGSA